MSFLRKEIDGLIYKTIECEMEAQQCYRYQPIIINGETVESEQKSSTCQQSPYRLFQSSFMKDEPITRVFRDKSLQSKEELRFWDEALYHEPVKDGVSLIVVDPAKGNQVVGMRISETKSRAKESNDGDGEEEQDLTQFSFYAQLVFHVLDAAGSAEVFILDWSLCKLY